MKPFNIMLHDRSQIRVHTVGFHTHGEQTKLMRTEVRTEVTLGLIWIRKGQEVTM